MKLINYLLAICVVLGISSCDAIVGIFEAGFNTGVIIVLIVIVLIIAGLFKMFGGSKKQ
ncbi:MULTISPECIES: hypothetical protein [Emticicia]|uniref:hypothetical protein n=1 Tax=Emticicia TaxID=312278 RepID=UPI00209CD417|nr:MULTISPECIES: hypothetical protein [Emticicia]UTA69820.1 hypothetical protein MB380_08405 [Emticicia sp. 21SJ11W-3]